MASSDSDNTNDKPSGKPNEGDNETKQAKPDITSNNYRLPFAIRLGQPGTFSDIMSGKTKFKPQKTLIAPTVTELAEQCGALLESKDPGEAKPNNGFPDGTCAGCGSEKGKDGGNLSQCARCKERKYCSRQCQKKDWSKHKAGCKQA